MLNVKALNDLLSQNRDERLCKRWYILTPNGTLLAHSQPTNAHDLRRQQLAFVALNWQEGERQAVSGLIGGGDADGERRDDAESSHLNILIIESESSNTIIQRLQSQLLLVLEGGVPPRSPDFEITVTAEADDGQQWRLRYNQTTNMETNASTSSIADGDRTSHVTSNVLKLQRRKLDDLATAIINDFQRKDFSMPKDGTMVLF